MKQIILTTFIASASATSIITRNCNREEIRNAFDGGYGACSSYASGQYNHNWCKKDADILSGCLASQTCAECVVTGNAINSDVIGPGNKPLKLMTEGPCEISNWQVIPTLEGCTVAKWKEWSGIGVHTRDGNTVWSLQNEGHMEELRALGFTADMSASAWQKGCFYDSASERVYFNGDMTSEARAGQGFCAWRFPAVMHYTIASDDLLTCEAAGDHVIQSEVECLQAAISENPGFSGSYTVDNASPAWPSGCSLGLDNQAMFNEDMTSGRGIKETARPLCRTKTQEEKIRERIRANALRHAETSEQISRAHTNLQTLHIALLTLQSQETQSSRSLAEINNHETTIASQTSEINVLIAAQRSLLTTEETAAFVLQKESIDAMKDGNTELAQEKQRALTIEYSMINQATEHIAQYEQQVNDHEVQLEGLREVAAVTASQLTNTQSSIATTQASVDETQATLDAANAELAFGLECNNDMCEFWDCRDWCKCFRPTVTYKFECRDDGSDTCTC